MKNHPNQTSQWPCLKKIFCTDAECGNSQFTVVSTIPWQASMDWKKTSSERVNEQATFSYGFSFQTLPWSSQQWTETWKCKQKNALPSPKLLLMRVCYTAKEKQTGPYIKQSDGERLRKSSDVDLWPKHKQHLNKPTSKCIQCPQTHPKIKSAFMPHKNAEH